MQNRKLELEFDLTPKTERGKNRPKAKRVPAECKKNREIKKHPAK